MTRKQIAFCRAYFECHNGAEAARRSGYSERTARQIAWKIKHKSRVDLTALDYAHTILTLPTWPFTIDGRILPPHLITAAHKAFLSITPLPAWFIADIKKSANP